MTTEPAVTDPTDPAVDPVATDPAAVDPAPKDPAVDPAKEPTPVDYTFDPVEGIDAEFDNDVVEIAKKLELTKEQAITFRQHEIDLAKKEMEDSKAESEAQKLAKEQELAKFDAENKAHKEYGGQKYAETEIKIGKLVAQVGEKTGLAKALAENPNLIKIPVFRNMLAEWANQISEATFVQAGSHTGQHVSTQELLYGKS